MVTLTTKICKLRHACTTMSYTKICRRYYIENVQQELKKNVHPYKQFHPWKSLREFSEDLINNIIYHKDGLVALNKPYGIKRIKFDSHTSRKNFIPHGVYYTLEDALPFIARQLNYPNLTIVRSPEMYMTGIVLLAANAQVQNAIELAFIHTLYFAKTYWIVTVGVPTQLKGEHRLAMKLASNPQFKNKKAVITTSWSKNDEKLQRIKLLKTQYQVLSNSTLNLCSLIQIKSSTAKWHALRLFASTFLYCPILGDRLCSSLIQKVGNTYVKVDPFLACANPPKLDNRLLKLLNVSNTQTNIIPAHIHLRSIVLPHICGETLTIEAPLLPPFDWTFKQLEFKNFV